MARRASECNAPILSARLSGYRSTRSGLELLSSMKTGLSTVRRRVVWPFPERFMLFLSRPGTLLFRGVNHLLPVPKSSRACYPAQSGFADGQFQFVNEILSSISGFSRVLAQRDQTVLASVCAFSLLHPVCGHRLLSVRSHADSRYASRVEPPNMSRAAAAAGRVDDPAQGIRIAIPANTDLFARLTSSHAESRYRIAGHYDAGLLLRAMH